MGQPDGARGAKRLSSGIRDLDPAVAVARRREAVRVGVAAGRWHAATGAAAVSLAEYPGLDLSGREWSAFVDQLQDVVVGALGWSGTIVCDRSE